MSPWGTGIVGTDWHFPRREEAIYWLRAGYPTSSVDSRHFVRRKWLGLSRNVHKEARDIGRSWVVVCRSRNSRTRGSNHRLCIAAKTLSLLSSGIRRTVAGRVRTLYKWLRRGKPLCTHLSNTTIGIWLGRDCLYLQNTRRPGTGKAGNGRACIRAAHTLVHTVHRLSCLSRIRLWCIPLLSGLARSPCLCWEFYGVLS